MNLKIAALIIAFAVALTIALAAIEMYRSGLTSTTPIATTTRIPHPTTSLASSATPSTSIAIETSSIPTTTAIYPTKSTITSVEIPSPTVTTEITTVTKLTTTPIPSETKTVTLRPSEEFYSPRTIEELRSVLQKVLELRSLYGAEYVYTVPMATPTIAIVREEVAKVVPLAKPVTAEVGGRVSGTNVQVEGIDELDIVKTDGKRIYVASGNKLFVLDASERIPKVIAKLQLKWSIRGLFVYRDRVVVVASQPIYRIMVVPPPGKPPVYGGNTAILVYRLGSKGLELIKNITITGSVVTGRLSGKHMYLVLNKGITRIEIPVIAGKEIPLKDIYVIDVAPDSSYVIVFAMDLETLKHSAKAFIASPSTRIYLSRSGNLYLISRVPSYVIALKVLESVYPELPSDLQKLLKPYIEAKDIAKILDALKNYFSKLASTDYKKLIKIVDLISEKAKRVSIKTAIYLFRVDGLSIEFVAKTWIDGEVRDQFAIEERNGYFIVASTVRRYAFKVYARPPPQYTPSRPPIIVVVSHHGKTTTYTYTVTPIKTVTSSKPRYFVSVYVYPDRELWNNLYVLKLPKLEVVAKIEGIAKGERVYAARLVGNLFFLVTYRRVDPLFAIDISDPEHPKIIGWLEMPGYSEYLHPLSDRYLLGIGVSDRPWGTKFSLIDVSNPKKMSEVSKIVIPYAWTPLWHDYHAFLHDPDYRYVAIPINVHGMGALAIVKYDLGKGYLEKPIIIEHPGAMRALYIGNTLYSIASTSIKVIDIETMKPIAEVPLR